MTAAHKIAITLPMDQVVQARRAVATGQAPSVSAYVSAAIARQQRADALAGVLAELHARHGAPTPEDYAWADEALGLTA